MLRYWQKMGATDQVEFTVGHVVTNEGAASDIDFQGLSLSVGPGARLTHTYDSNMATTHGERVG